MKIFLHLITFKFKSLFSGRLDLSLKSLLKNGAAGLVYFLFAFGTYRVTSASLQFLLRDIHLDVFLFHNFLSILLFMFFLSVNVGNMLVSVSGLYRGKEVNYLLTKPIAFEKIFLLKFLENFFSSSGSLFVILFSVFYAYAEYFHLTAWFFGFVTFGLFLPFTLISGLLGIIILFGLIQLAQKIGVRLTAILMIVIYLVVLALFFASNDPTAIIMQTIRNTQYAGALFQQFNGLALKLLPNYWVTCSLYWFVQGKFMLSFGFAGLLILVAAAFLLFSYLLAARVYYKTYVMSSELQARRKSKTQLRIPALVSFEKQMSRLPAVEMIFRKEAALFMRDPVQVIHLLFMFFLMLLFLFGLRERPNDMFHSLNPSTQSIIYLSLQLFDLFLITSLCLRFVFPHMSLEGESYWKLRSAPVHLRHFFRWRFIAYFCILLIVGEILNYFSNKRFSTDLLSFGMIVTFLVTWTVAAINYALGCYYANYREKNAIRLSSSQGASAAFLLCLLYLGIVIGLIFPVVYSYFLLTQNQHLNPGFRWFMPALFKVIPLSLLLILASYRLTMKEVTGDLKNLI